jgi:hypothetical protein
MIYQKFDNATFKRPETSRKSRIFKAYSAMALRSNKKSKPI